MEERRLDSESKAKLARGIIVAIIVLYWVCPDLFPGPIDDTVVGATAASKNPIIDVAKNKVDNFFNLVGYPSVK